MSSSQVTFIYIALLTIQIVTKHCISTDEQNNCPNTQCDKFTAANGHTECETPTQCARVTRIRDYLYYFFMTNIIFVQ